jgi:hypothetical protein
LTLGTEREGKEGRMEKVGVSEVLVSFVVGVSAVDSQTEKEKEEAKKTKEEEEEESRRMVEEPMLGFVFV